MFLGRRQRVSIFLLGFLMGNPGCSRQPSQPAEISSTTSPAVNNAVDDHVTTATLAAKPSDRHDVKALAAQLAEGVGTVTRTSELREGPIVMALEERHNSRTGQIQHAIMLSRMYEQHGLRNIVLEGYLKGDPDIASEWFAKSVKPNAPVARAGIAVSLLQRGDISAAEFTKLVYPDVTLSRAEEHANYVVEPPASFPMVEYLKSIASVNPEWAIQKSKPYQSIENFQKLSGEEKASSAREIKEFAEQHNVSVKPKSAREMQQYVAFFEKRMASNETIAASLEKAMGTDATDIVATNIGSDHSQGLCKLLDAAGRPYAVISPLYVPSEKERGDLSDEMYERKNKRLPVFATGLSQLVFKEMSKKQKKPQPVLGETWFQAEAELHGFVASLAEGVLGPPDPPGPPNGGEPPFGFSGGDYDGKHIQIPLAQVEYVKREKSRSPGLLIPVVFKATGRKIYVGARLSATRGLGTVESGESTNTVETILQQALTEMEAEEKPPVRAEGESGVIKFGLRVEAFVETDPARAKHLLTSGV